MSSVVELQNVSFSYNGRPVLHDINLAVYTGDFMGLIGPNGTGKSTLIRLAVGLLTPHHGEVRLLGKAITRFKDWHRIGYMAQKAAAFNTSFPATVQEIVETHLRAQVRPAGHLDSTTIRKKVKHALELTGMEEFRTSLIGELSGGQQQRVILARVLVSEPEIMFLDEPLAGIDYPSQQLFCSLLQHLNKELSITILMVTHDPTVIAGYINRLACLEQGTLFTHDGQEEIRGELARTMDSHHHLVYHQHQLP